MPAFLYGDFTSVSTSTADSAGGQRLRNRTDAAVGAQQYSPIRSQEASGWKTDATAAAVACRLYTQVRPVQGAAAPTFLYVWSAKIGSASAVDLIQLDSAANLLWSVDGTGSIGAAGATRPAAIYGVNLVNITTTAIGATPTEAKAAVLRNSTAAAAGAQQWSPPVYHAGQGWKTTATAASQEVIFRQGCIPVQGTTSPTGQFSLYYSINGGAYTFVNYVDTSGNNVSAGHVYSGSGLTIMYSTQTTSGFGTTASFGGTTDRPVVLHSMRTSGAGNISVGITADVNAAAINADHEVCMVGWTNNSDALTKLFGVYGDGRLRFGKTRAADTTVPTFANLPTSGTAGQSVWIEWTDGTTKYVVPGWTVP